MVILGIRALELRKVKWLTSGHKVQRLKEKKEKKAPPP